MNYYYDKEKSNTDWNMADYYLSNGYDVFNKNSEIYKDKCI